MCYTSPFQHCLMSLYNVNTYNNPALMWRVLEQDNFLLPCTGNLHRYKNRANLIFTVSVLNTIYLLLVCLSELISRSNERNLPTLTLFKLLICISGSEIFRFLSHPHKLLLVDQQKFRRDGSSLKMCASVMLISRKCYRHCYTVNGRLLLMLEPT